MALRSLRPRTNDTSLPAPTDEPLKPEATYIDASCEFAGQLRFDEPVRIDGRVSGEIHAKKSLVVGETASIEADIHAESMIVSGSVDGDVCVKRKITLLKTARVSGEIQTAGIVVEEGARFKGRILIGDEAPEAPAAAPTPRSPKGSDGAPPTSATSA
jgi:cytoskeletal protein CcmA (bactofilin family)